MRKRRSFVGRLLSPFTRDERGAVAVEFAILALPFFTIIFAILETSIVFFATQVFDAAIQDASRKVRTGQSQSWDADDFRDAMCDRLYGLFDCNGVKVRVEVVNSFASAGPLVSPIAAACLDPQAALEDLAEDCAWTIVEGFNPGIGGSIVMVQAHYKWPTIINLPGVNLANLADGTRLLSAVRVFKNEPF